MSCPECDIDEHGNPIPPEPCEHNYRGTPIKGRRWCIKFGCGEFEPQAPKRVRAAKAPAVAGEQMGLWP